MIFTSVRVGWEVGGRADKALVLVYIVDIALAVSSIDGILPFHPTI